MKTNSNQELVPRLKSAIKTLAYTKTQCREMLQLVDNLSAHITTDKRKKEHARQQDYWASNLVHVSEHLAAMQESVDQIEEGKLSNKKHVTQSVIAVIEQAGELANYIERVYRKIVISIAPIEQEIQNEIEREQQRH